MAPLDVVSRFDVTMALELDGSILGRLGLVRVEELPLLGVICWPLFELDPNEL